MSFIDLDISGLVEMRRSFAALSRMSAEELGLAQALTEGAEGIMRESRPLVPVVTGTLRASGIVELPILSQDEVEVGMGYGGAARAYALKVHENPRAGQTGGISPQGKRYRRWSQVGQWKFLEQPFLAARQRVLDAIAAEVARRIEAAT
jgi:hypothetical protein